MISADPTATAPDAAPANAALAAPQPLMFQGDSACGPFGLVLPRAADAQGAITGAEQVLRLAEAEPLIRAVEQWLRGPWDPAPLAPGAAVAAQAYRAVVRDPALAPPGSTLTVPLAALQLPPPDALRAPALAWDAHHATVVLGEVPAEALAQLQVGSLLWLPASLATAWAVQLIDADQQLAPCPARLDLAAQRITVLATGAAGGAPAQAAALQVVLSRAVQLPLDHWLGWGRAGAPCHWPTPQPWAAELRQGATVLARGALLPMGEGCGLRVEAVDLPQWAA